MMLPLNALWFVVLILVLTIFCTAFLMNVRLFWVLLLTVLVLALALTMVSLFSKRGRERRESLREETILLEYLKSHGIGGGLSELSNSIGITEEKIIKRLRSLEDRGAIPPGSASKLA
jgi:ABC-type multidrug transport system fused ATPase/permease subunit